MNPVAFNLYVDTTDGQLLTSQSNQQAVNPLDLPLFQGDVLTLNVYLYQRIPAGTNPVANFPFQIIPNAGITLNVFLSDGSVDGTNGSNNPYAAAIVWIPDPTNSFLQGSLNLSTADLATLLHTPNGSTPVTNKFVWLTIAYSSGGVWTTGLKVQVNIGVGGGNLNAQAPVPLAQYITIQQAELMFWRIQPTKGQPLYLATQDGRVLMLTAVDDAGGAGCHLDASPTNEVIS